MASRRNLAVDLDGLVIALDTDSDEVRYFLDLETGEVIMVSDETRDLAEEIVNEIPEDQEVTREALEVAIEGRDEPDWLIEAAIQAALIEEGYGKRYLEVEPVETHDAYQDMETFIETVADPRLQRELERAISGRGAFRRFKDTLLDYPAERQRWFAFQNDVMRQRAIEWLHNNGIEPLPKPGAQPAG